MKLTTDTAAMSRWLRTPRTAQSKADYACAVQHNVKPASWHPAELVFMAGFVLFLVFGF